jgi:hypothetical protein
MTSQKQTSLFTEEQLTSSQEASPANHTQVQESGSEKKMSAICGPACLEQFEKFNQVGLWAKTFSALLIGMEGWYSKRCKLIWKLKGTKSNRMYFQLRLLTLHTEEIGFGLLPTPRAQEIDNSKERIANNQIDSLPTMAKMGLLPTPTAQEFRDSQLTPEQAKKLDKGGRVLRRLGTMDLLQDGIASQLSPQFVLEMMGFPTDWTELPFLNGETNQ